MFPWVTPHVHQTVSAFREIDTKLGGVRRYHEQLAEEGTWLSYAENEFSVMKKNTVNVKELTKLSSEITSHTNVVIDLKDNVKRLNLGEVR